MAGISNLYAEIGFKVNESGLQEFTKRLASLKKEIDGIAQSLTGIQSLKINISSPKIKTEFEKLANQNIRTQLAVRREDRLERAFQYRQQQDKERKEEKREKDKERSSKRLERSILKGSRDFVHGVWAAGSVILTALKKGFEITNQSAAASMAYKNYELLTGDAISNIQGWRALAAATGAGNANQIMGQIVGLKQNWANIVRNEGNVNDLKLLGIKAYQNPTEMGQAILRTIQEGNVDPAVIATSLRNLGLDDAGWFRMARATTEQVEMAQKLKALMPTDAQIENMNEWYRDLSSLRDVTGSLKDKFTNAFIGADPEKIKRFVDLLSSEEMIKSVEIIANGLSGLANILEKSFGWAVNIGKSIGSYRADIASRESQLTGFDKFWRGANKWTLGLIGMSDDELIKSTKAQRDIAIENAIKINEINRKKSIELGNIETTEALRNIDRIAVGGIGGYMRENQFNDNKTVTNYVTVGSVGEAQEFVGGKSTFSNAFGDLMIMPTGSGG